MHFYPNLDDGVSASGRIAYNRPPEDTAQPDQSPPGTDRTTNSEQQFRQKEFFHPAMPDSFRVLSGYS